MVLDKPVTDIAFPIALGFDKHRLGDGNAELRELLSEVVEGAIDRTGVVQIRVEIDPVVFLGQLFDNQEEIGKGAILAEKHADRLAVEGCFENMLAHMWIRAGRRNRGEKKRSTVKSLR